MKPGPQAPHILVVGGGVAGLEIATDLGRQARRHGRFHVTLLDADSAHIWKPMLHTIAASTRDVYQQQVAYAAQAHTNGFVYQPGAMCGLNPQTRHVEVAPLGLPDGRVLLPSRSIGYDALVIAVGSQANDFGTPGVREHCSMIDSRLQADSFGREMRACMLQSMANGTELAVCIVGGGATGVELAAELVQLAEMADEYGGAGMAARLKLTLVDSGPRLLAAFPEPIARAAQQRLESLGVLVRNGARVETAGSDGLRLADGEFIPATLMVWAAGVKAPDFLQGIGNLETARGNQLVVTAGLQATRDPAVFAVGDCASLTLPGHERPLPPTAQVAHQHAQHLVRHLPNWLLNHKPMPAFAYRDFGALVSLAQYDAYGLLGKFGLFGGGSIRGRLAQLSHAMLYRAHQSRLHGFWRGSLIWAVDRINTGLRPSIRLD